MMLEKSSTPAVDGGAAAHQLKVRLIILHHPRYLQTTVQMPGQAVP